MHCNCDVSGDHLLQCITEGRVMMVTIFCVSLFLQSYCVQRQLRHERDDSCSSADSTKREPETPPSEALSVTPDKLN